QRDADERVVGVVLRVHVPLELGARRHRCRIGGRVQEDAAAFGVGRTPRGHEATHDRDRADQREQFELPHSLLLPASSVPRSANVSYLRGAPGSPESSAIVSLILKVFLFSECLSRHGVLYAPAVFTHFGSTMIVVPPRPSGLVRYRVVGPPSTLAAHETLSSA